MAIRTGYTTVVGIYAKIDVNIYLNYDAADQDTLPRKKQNDGRFQLADILTGVPNRMRGSKLEK